ncbi:hypothetical protein GGR54DRAFT_323799 [Hypoxylon sp. NC1633]|nr:hypothetical protein GGR54DRAFT_323799 [Hypoxylon sp. NC1633]
MQSHLPNEILHQIFSHFLLSLRRKHQNTTWDKPLSSNEELEDECARKLALSRISRTSKLFRTVALPLLYHTIPIISEKLLENISKHAHLAELVRVIDLTPVRIPIHSLHNALRAAGPRVSLPSDLEYRVKKHIFYNPRERIAESLLYLICLPNLETLYYGIEDPVKSIILDVFRWIAERGRASRLRHLHLQCWAPKGTTHITDVQEFLLPTIETLRGFTLGWEINPESGYGPPERPFYLMNRNRRLNLQHIDLVDTMINDKGFEDMLSRCPHLRTLRLIWNEDIVDPLPLDLYAMGDAIRNLAPQLEMLILDPLGNVDSYGSLGPLHKLTRLKELAVPQLVLCGGHRPDDEEDDKDIPALTLAEVVPDSLETLYLIECQEDGGALNGQITDLFTDVGLVHLCKIRIERYYPCKVDAYEFGWSMEMDLDAITFIKKGSAADDIRGNYHN